MSEKSVILVIAESKKMARQVIRQRSRDGNIYVDVGRLGKIISAATNKVLFVGDYKKRNDIDHLMALINERAKRFKDGLVVVE